MAASRAAASSISRLVTLSCASSAVSNISASSACRSPGATFGLCGEGREAGLQQRRVGARAQVAQQSGADPAQFDGAAGAASVSRRAPACSSAVSATGRVRGTTCVKFWREAEKPVSADSTLPRTSSVVAAVRVRRADTSGTAIWLARASACAEAIAASLSAGRPKLAQHDRAVATHLDQADQRRLRGGIDHQLLARQRAAARRPMPAAHSAPAAACSVSAGTTAA